MENSNKVERSELWNDIYNVVKQIPRKEVNSDAVDAPSATTSIEKLIEKYKTKAEKWDKLDNKLAEMYGEGDDDGSETDLCDIGEAASTAFGYL